MEEPAPAQPTIVRTKSRRASVFGDAPDMTQEEHRQRGDAADALWRDLLRRTAGGECQGSCRLNSVMIPPIEDAAVLAA